MNNNNNKTTTKNAYKSFFLLKEIYIEFYKFFMSNILTKKIYCTVVVFFKHLVALYGFFSGL